MMLLLLKPVMASVVGLATLAPSTPGYDADSNQLTQPPLDDDMPSEQVGTQGNPSLATIGSIWRRGGDKSPSVIDRMTERITPPQAYVLARWEGAQLGAGLLATFRERTRARWDYGRGQLLTRGPQNEWGLDDIYARAAHEGLRLVVGSFDATFGERLTFATTRDAELDGWSQRTRVSDDDQRGELKVHAGLFGMALSWTGANGPGGWWDATLVGSRRTYDVGQYRGIWYAYDDDANPRCATDSNCRPGYICDSVLKVCRSSSAYPAEQPASDPATGEPATSYRYLTFSDALRETLLAGHLSYHFDDERSSIGVTFYRSQTQIMLAAAAHPRFARNARYSNVDGFGAVGVNGRTGSEQVLLSGEYTNSGAGGHAGYGRIHMSLSPRGQVALALRYYDARYVNPHGQGECAPDLEQGSEARNEMGLRVTAVVSPWPGLRLDGGVDLWRRVQSARLGADGRSEWQWTWRAPLSLRLRQRVSYSLLHERLWALVQYDDKDLSNDGDASSRAEAETDVGASTSASVSGGRRSLQLGVQTKRIQHLRLLAAVAVSDDGGGRVAQSGGYQQLYRLQADVHVYASGELTVAAQYWHDSRNLGSTQPSDRRRPLVDAYSGLCQELFENLSISLRYGIVLYRDRRPDHFAWYHVVKAQATARF